MATHLVSSKIQKEASLKSSPIQKVASSKSSEIQKEASLKSSEIQKEASLKSSPIQKEESMKSSEMQKEASLKSSGIQKKPRSNPIFEFSCSMCKENGLGKNATFYCEKCSKCYCDNCLWHHKQLYKKHLVIGRKELRKWPVVKATAAELGRCKVQVSERLTAFCEEHGDLLCQKCHLYEHQKCTKVVLTADKVKDPKQMAGFTQLMEDVSLLKKQVHEKKHNLEENLQSLQKTYEEILKLIDAAHKKAAEDLVKLKNNTVKELEILTAASKTFVQSDMRSSTMLDKKLESLHDIMRNIEQKADDDPTDVFIIYKTFLDQVGESKALLQRMVTKGDIKLAFNPNNAIEAMLSNFKELGKTVSNVNLLQEKATELKPPGMNPIVRINLKTWFSVYTEKDSSTCFISGICETANSELIIADRRNRNVKLLDKAFRIVAQCDLAACPITMCSLAPNMVAVAVDGFSAIQDFQHKSSRYQIHSIKVTNGQLLLDKTWELNHKCTGIAHHNGNLYIASGTALYLYTVNGKQIGKLHEHFAKDLVDTITTCAVSPDGARIYLADPASNKLVTLSGNGRMISKLFHPAFQCGFGISGIHVTDLGQVLVCGGMSNTIIQVDRDGHWCEAEVVTDDDGVIKPSSAYFSKSTNALIVGQRDANNIMVFKGVDEK